MAQILVLHALSSSFFNNGGNEKYVFEEMNSVKLTVAKGKHACKENIDGLDTMQRVSLSLHNTCTE